MLRRLLSLVRLAHPEARRPAAAFRTCPRCLAILPESMDCGCADG
jgi:hypothetical protein